MPMLIATAIGVVFFTIVTWRLGQGRRLVALREIAIIVGSIFAYFAVRRIAEADPASAILRAESIVEFERTLGFFFEPIWQAAIIESELLVTAVNWVYIWGHWPVIAFSALLIYVRAPGVYRLYRNAFFLSGAIGIVLFWQFPTAPPRLMDLGIQNTVALYSQWYRVLQPPSLVNQFAAFPSLHFGWNILLGLAMFLASTRGWIKTTALLLTVAMFISIVLTGNHFIIDAIAGAAVVLVGLGIAYWVQRYSQSRGLAAGVNRDLSEVPD
jgi:membrane-associated phospholipid phosphatase